MFNITNHQGNANKNHNEISPYTSQNGYCRKVYYAVHLKPIQNNIEKKLTDKYWQGCGEKGNII